MQINIRSRSSNPAPTMTPIINPRLAWCGCSPGGDDVSESPLFRGGLIDRGGEGEPPSLDLLFPDGVEPSLLLLLILLRSSFSEVPDGGDGVEPSLLLLLILLRSSFATGEGGDGLCGGGDWLDGA